MQIQIICPGCGRLIKADESLSGKKVACPFCRKKFTATQETRADRPEDQATGLLPAKRWGHDSPVVYSGGEESESLEGENTLQSAHGEWAQIPPDAPVVCPRCMHYNSPDSQFCRICGAGIRASAPDPIPHAAGINVYAGPQRTSGLAIASLVLGLIGGCGLGSLLAIILGHSALSEINRSEGAVGGRGMAIAGIALGYIGIIGGLIWLLFLSDGWADSILYQNGIALAGILLLQAFSLENLSGSCQNRGGWDRRADFQ